MFLKITLVLTQLIVKLFFRWKPLNTSFFRELFLSFHTTVVTSAATALIHSAKEMRKAKKKPKRVFVFIFFFFFLSFREHFCACLFHFLLSLGWSSSYPAFFFKNIRLKVIIVCAWFCYICFGRSSAYSTKKRFFSCLHTHAMMCVR